MIPDAPPPRSGTGADDQSDPHQGARPEPTGEVRHDRLGEDLDPMDVVRAAGIPVPDPVPELDEAL